MRALCVLALLATTPAYAHTFGKSYSDVKPASGGVRVTVDLDPDDLAEPLRGRFDDNGSGDLSAVEMERHQDLVAALLSRGYVLRSGGTACAAEVENVRTSPEAHMVRTRLRFLCPEE